MDDIGDPPPRLRACREEIVMAGFGGQGVVLAGKLLTIAAMRYGYHVSNIPSYGAEMRGGTAHCAIIISSAPIATPIVESPTVVLAFNDPSLEKFEPKLRPGGLLIYDISLMQTKPQRHDIHAYPLQALSTAENLGLPKAANMVFLGCLLALKNYLAPPKVLIAALDESVSLRNRRFNPANRKIILAAFEHCSAAPAGDQALPLKTGQQSA